MSKIDLMVMLFWHGDVSLCDRSLVLLHLCTLCVAAFELQRCRATLKRYKIFTVKKVKIKYEKNITADLRYREVIN